MDLYPHQQKALEKLDHGKILLGDVGTGKSLTAMAYFYTKECGGIIGQKTSMTKPMDLYIITTAKKRDSFDWETEAARFGLGRDRDANAYGIKVTVDSWNNLKNYTGVTNAFFIFDEQRLVGSGKWTRAFLKIAKSNRWILLTATPGDTWLDYIPVFVANGFYKNRTEFIREHVIYNTFTKFPKVDRYIGEGRLIRLRNSLLVDMPYERHTRRIKTEVDVAYDEYLFTRVWRDRWHVYEERPIRDAGELFLVARKVVNSDVSRLEAVRKLSQKHKKLIVFYNFDYELEMLRTLAQENETWITPTDSPTMSESSRRTSPSTNVKPSSPSRSSRRTATGPASRSSGSGPTPSRPKQAARAAAQDAPHGSQEKPISSGTSTRLQSPQSTTIAHIQGSTQVLTSEASSSNPPNASKSESFAVAEWNGHKHQEIPKTDRWIYLVQYTAGAEGWNCIDTDAMVFYSLNYSYKIFHQAHGRIDRLNTPFTDLHYYILKSSSMIDRLIWKALAFKKSFNERSVKVSI